MAEAAAQVVSVPAQRWLLPQAANTQLPLVQAAQAVDQTPEATALTPYSTRSLQPVAEVVAELDKMVVPVVAGVTTILPAAQVILRLFSRLKETMAARTVAPATEQVAVVVVPQKQDRLLVLSMTMPAMAARVRHLLFLAHL
jgi:uncharacterized membrane protein